MVVINVPLGDRSYKISIQSGLLLSFGEILKALCFPKNIAIITNTTVNSLYGDQVTKILSQKDFKTHFCVLPDGEEYKNLDKLRSIYDYLIQKGFDRGCGIIALGGGVIGDMAGFAAATFLRGIPYVQIPTTLLSQVDSSVGGKTAVNHPLGKNLIGAFYQPEAVLIDIDTLRTLDPREVSAGLAEVVKYGVIYDNDFFVWLENNAVALRQLEPNALVHAIKRSCEIKSDIVGQDEKEGSIRAYLNFGHTFGHAIESLSGYGVWKHGEAVSAGMVIAAKIAHIHDLCSQDDVDRISGLLIALNLPVDAPNFSHEDYLDSIQRDKKVKAGRLSLVLNMGIGSVTLKQVDNLSNVISSVL